MKVLVVGGGGREHALVWKIRQSPRVAAVFCAPGNAGIAEIAETVPIAANDIAALARYAHETAVDLTVVGPEQALCDGIVDVFQARGLRVFGPTKAAARLEGSKVATKELLARHGIATAPFRVFDDAGAAKTYARAHGGPLVVKADGLAAGKGVAVCGDTGEACRAIDEILGARRFGAAGDRIVVEERLDGEEVSILALTDGDAVIPLAPAQDHKRIRDGDEGPNTGGMGAYSPAPLVTPEMERRVTEEILVPVVRGLAAEGIVYRGILYAGLMVDRGQVRVLEFNVRFGDPECQPLMLRLESDLVELMERTIGPPDSPDSFGPSERSERRKRSEHRDPRASSRESVRSGDAPGGGLADARIEWDARAAVCVVIAAGGYPGEVEQGKVIRGLDALRGWRNGVVFHAGTRRADGETVTAGGRVLGVTGLGADIAGAIDETYRAVRAIEFDGMQYRTDIGRRALARP
jgi:phosphoribosylamine--glycine ligase